MNEDIKTPATRSTIAARKAAALNELGEGKAQVTETKTKVYIEKNDETNQKDNPLSASSTANYPITFNDAPLNETPLMRVLRELKEYDSEPETEFVAMVTRRQDSMNDNFKRKCYNDEQFLPLYFRSKDVINFPSILFRANKDSGGKFLLVITDESGEYITRYFLTVPNDLLPPENVPTNQGNNESLNMVQMFNQMIQKQDERFAQLINVMQSNQPQQRTLMDSLQELKLLQEISGQQNNGNANSQIDVASTVNNAMQSVAVTQAIANGFANMFNQNQTPVSEPKAWWQELLDNPQALQYLAAMWNTTTTNLINGIALAMNKSDNTPQPQPQPQPQNVQENESIMKQQLIFNEITSELERLDKESLPITADNPILLKLAEQHADIYPLIVNFAKSSEFDKVWDILTEQILSDDLTEKYLDEQGDLTVDGIKIKAKVKELYDLWKNS